MILQTTGQCAGAFRKVTFLIKRVLGYVVNCEEVGLVIRLQLLFGEVRSVTTALKVVEEVQEEVQEIERE